MATDKTTKQDAPAQETASKYGKRELITAAKNLFKVRPEIMAGALYGADEQLTVEEATKLLDEFRKKEVK